MRFMNAALLRSDTCTLEPTAQAPLRPFKDLSTSWFTTEGDAVHADSTQLQLCHRTSLRLGRTRTKL